jgi:hypothetical protein
MVTHNCDTKIRQVRQTSLHGVFTCEKVDNPFYIHESSLTNMSTFVYKM